MIRSCFILWIPYNMTNIEGLNRWRKHFQKTVCFDRRRYLANMNDPATKIYSNVKCECLTCNDLFEPKSNEDHRHVSLWLVVFGGWGPHDGSPKISFSWNPLVTLLIFWLGDLRWDIPEENQINANTSPGISRNFCEATSSLATCPQLCRQGWHTLQGCQSSQAGPPHCPLLPRYTQKGDWMIGAYYTRILWCVEETDLRWAPDR